MTAPVIVWFRRDLRLQDNPALDAAAATGKPILPLFILDRHGPDDLGAAGRWWLDKSLYALDGSIQVCGGRLIVREGAEEAELRRVIQETGARQVFMNRRFEPTAFEHDADIAHGLHSDRVECTGFNGALFTRPGSVLNGQGRPYRVFTPFMKALRPLIGPPTDAPHEATLFADHDLSAQPIEALSLHPRSPDWSTGFDWAPGEAGAHAALQHFIANALPGYATNRDRPDRQGVSRLSPYLHWGEISVRRVAQRVLAAADSDPVLQDQAEKFVSELGWREFSAHLLFQFPTMKAEAFRPEYDAMPWRDDAEGFAAWSQGRTGYPLIDAGMRQLWRTGWMHNRVRMIVASFLVKDLMVDWRRGAAWFHDSLVDADTASNIQNWQWVAGSGADAAPYFRIFNPVSQGETHDPDGHYVRRWVPELAPLPNRFIHAPWTAPTEILRQAGISLGHNYPMPVVDHAKARRRALEALKSLHPPRIERRIAGP
ncbi:deoxyribodipyrimidine photo-lyase [Brevundimonas sp. SORGH_AS_0993]|uniref:cryptochrome/photolyase family protein n=1 Tax=Brevundimonas sp. SORGH_AS_0993 TaxID=3041794 RepID=UPI00278B8800|nr:deoxyribodipyrimidine photo-lyase [Brevundimonas sp. SORGH_AS_0993]MDQ1153246.1 deoxyribodipyrimidine photo-lyase [Brevundimonas sp. SORGH_AS_0993]